MNKIDYQISIVQSPFDGKSSNSLKIEYEWLDTDQAAAYLKLSVGTLRNMTSNGKIPYYKVGRKNLYRIEELRQLLVFNKRGVRDEF